MIRFEEKMNILKKVLYVLFFSIIVLFTYGCNNTTNYYFFNFESNGGSAITGYILLEGEIVNEPSPPNRPGFYFNGWYEDDGTFSNPYIFPGTMPDSSVTIYAKWFQCDDVANAPDLADGLTPVFWDIDGNLVRYGETAWDDSLWYDYSDTTNSLNTSKWANAISDDGSYWVWIPRFVYTISTNWHRHAEGEINICFVDGNDDSTCSATLTNQDMATDSNMKWTNHPAFTFGDHELNGIWVAKFEASLVAENLLINPGMISMDTNIDIAYNLSLNMNEEDNPYGFKPDQIGVHLMKQEEWGAIAYLSHSIFGRNQYEITPNSSNYTGGANTNGWLLNGNQSTTGNFYGVYDMSGGKAEFVSAYIGDPDLSWAEECNDIDSEYCTRYESDIQYSIDHKGDAIYETSEFLDRNTAWFSHRSVFPSLDEVWFLRGGSKDPLSDPGIFAYDKIDPEGEAGFRPVLIVYPDNSVPLVTVTFNSLGNNVSVSNVSPGTTIYAPSVSNSNCSLVGWYYDTNYTTQATLPLTMPSHNITLYARWLCSYNCSKVNSPVLFTGMNPLYYNDNGDEIRKYLDVSSQTINPLWVESEWYSYNDTSLPNMENSSVWANAVSQDGSYWVWIPRFIYKVSSNWHESSVGIIDVCFVFGTQDSDTNHTLINTGMPTDSNGTWTSHPAFTFGSNELTGFWFAKYEASNSNGEILITHGVESWRSIPLNTVFDLSRAMETKSSLYGWSTSEVDTHQTKNEEWGAVAYLAHSKFGLNGNEIGHQGNGYWTGGGSFDAFLTNVQQSTTGNPSGVYDMRGGGMELVAAYNAAATITNSSCMAAGAPYCTAYSGTSEWGIDSKGDALYETSSGTSDNSGWFGNYTYWPLTSTPWLHRGGHYDTILNSGLFFFDGNWRYEYPQPDHYDRFTFRPVLIKKQGS